MGRKTEESKSAGGGSRGHLVPIYEHVMIAMQSGLLKKGPERGK